MRVDRKARAIGLLVGLSMVATACGGDDDSGGDVTPKVEGKKGGTLKLQGSGDVTNLDTATAYYTVSYTILRALTRQLVSYPNSPDKAKRDIPVADMVEGTADDWRSDDGLTYTFTLKSGLKWGAPVNREVTGQDFVTGIKRLCDPNNPSGGLIYYTDTIKGLQAFCDGLGKVKVGDVAAVKTFIEGNQIEGVVADGRKITITLKAPAGDFLYMLAMPFASPVPHEHVLKYLADGPEFRKNFVGNGPYKIDEYVPEKSFKLSRNPNWTEDSDKLRAAWVDKIEVVMGSDEEPTQQAIEAGTVDLAWDVAVPTVRLSALTRLKDAQLKQEDDGCVSYIVFNPKRKPFDNVKVRQAVNYAVDKTAIVQVAGGPNVQTPTGNILTPPILGYKKLDLYPTPDNKGDPAKAKTLLAEAGYPNGIDPIFIYRSAGKHPTYAATHQAALLKAGIRAKLKAVTPAAFYSEHLSKLNSNSWDFAQAGWCPDWAGNAARTFFSPLLDGRTLKDGTTNYGQYNNPVFNEKLDAALAESDTEKAKPLWAELDEIAMKDAVWAPIQTGKVSNYHSKRVKNWVYFPFSHQADLTNVYLDPAT